MNGAINQRQFCTVTSNDLISLDINIMEHN